MNVRQFKFITITFYLSLLIILIVPILLQILNLIDLTFFADLLTFFRMNLNIRAIIILILSLALLLSADVFFIRDKGRIIKNIKLIEMTFGAKRSIFLNFTVSSLSGMAEEIFFRGYLYILCGYLVKSTMIIIIAISLVFALLHIIQGIQGLIVTFSASVMVFIIMITAHSIWYAVIFHILFNFIQLNFIIDMQKKKYFRKEDSV